MRIKSKTKSQKRNKISKDTREKGIKARASDPSGSPKQRDSSGHGKFRRIHESQQEMSNTPPKFLTSFCPCEIPPPATAASVRHSWGRSPLLHVEGRGRERSRILLMDPGQLLDDLYQVIHGGFSLHPAAIVNLHREEKALETLAVVKNIPRSFSKVCI